MTPLLSRRSVLAGFGAGVAAFVLPPLSAARAGIREYTLKASPAKARLVGPDGPETAVWAYNGATPGPVLRARRGETLRVVVENGLAQPTTVHWHGLRLPNAMDGVPFLTQDPVAPGGSFTYEFPCEDAGTYWYHPHFNSSEQVGMGLAGAIVIEDEAPPAVDRDILWVIDDWRLTPDGAIAPFGRGMHDFAHGGRLGNTVTVNGRVTDGVPVTVGERIRLRLVNTANARIFRLSFTGHRPWLVAIDGHPIEPRRLEEGQLVIGPGSRADLIIDMEGKPGTTYSVVDDSFEGVRYRLADLAYRSGRVEVLTKPERPAPAPLAANPLPEPDLAAATRLALTMEGGATGRMDRATYKGQSLTLRELARGHGMFWSFNGVVHPPMHYGDAHHDPMFTFRKGESVVMTVRNQTDFHHPIHLHGLTFRVLSYDGKAAPGRPWQDTVLLAPDGEAEIAFKADLAGDWMLHCHILEHQKTGMMGFVRVIA